MKASEAIMELQSIMEDTKDDPEISEFWLRIILGIGVIEYKKFFTGDGKVLLQLIKGEKVS